MNISRRFQGLATGTALSLAATFMGGCASGQIYTEGPNGNASVTPAQNVPMTCGGTIVDHGARNGNTITYDPDKSKVVRKCNFGDAARAKESTGIFGREMDNVKRTTVRTIGNEANRALRDALRNVFD